MHGVIEGPRQAVGGMRDAVQSIMDFEESFTDVAGRLESLVPLGGVQIYDQEGRFRPDYLSPEEWQRAMAEGGQEALPPIGEPSTLTGAGIRGITQFVRRFG